MITVAVEDPRAPDIVALLEAHLAFAHEVTPDDHVHALDVDALCVPQVTFCTARDDGVLLGVGALRDLGGGRGEIKSMHTAAAARGLGVGRRMVEHLLVLADARGLRWIGLETGTDDAFAAARALYASLGFETCPPFDDYDDNPHSVCMSLEPEPRARS